MHVRRARENNARKKSALCLLSPFLSFLPLSLRPPLLRCAVLWLWLSVSLCGSVLGCVLFSFYLFFFFIGV
jgi:hypothetical protein